MNMHDDRSSKDLVPYRAPASPARPDGAKGKRVARNPDGPRIPPSDGDIQSNFCRNINCENFGVPPLAAVSRGRHKKGQKRVADGYRIIGNRQGGQTLLCTKCGQSSSLKSNSAIREEVNRISAYLAGPQASCPNPDCQNHGADVRGHRALYLSHGRTKAGSPRWRCKACGRVFSERKINREQTKPHKNAIIFRMLVNKGAIRGISRVADVSLQTVYDKINFIHRQCLALLAERESRIAAMRLPRLYISTDRQDYVLNWTSRKDRKNTQLTAVASADSRSGYVFAMNVNFEPDVDLDRLEALAIVAGDFDKREPSFRRYARFWMSPDFEMAKKRDPRKVQPARSDTGSVLEDIMAGYQEMSAIPDPESKERTPDTTRLPPKGAQLHFEYTVHAHFRLLKKMFGNVGKIRFFMDQDDTLRAACISTFTEEMRQGRADAFYVKIDKGLNVDQRRRLALKSKKKFRRIRAWLARPDMSDWRIRVMLLEKAILKGMKFFSPRDRWVVYPESTMAEPLKAVCWLTDRMNQSIPLGQMAIVYARASLHTIDSFFMQIRRLLMALERPISTPSNDGRVWRGYGPYDPGRIQQLLDIYRAFHNFVKVGQDGKTPAMRLGLAKGPVRIEDILYSNGFRVRSGSKNTARKKKKTTETHR